MKNQLTKLKPIIAALVRLRGLLLTTLVLLLVGTLVYQFSRIVAAGPDPAYVKAEAAKIKHFKFDSKTIDLINGLQNVPANLPPASGKPDPFVP